MFDVLDYGKDKKVTLKDMEDLAIKYLTANIGEEKVIK